MTLKDKLMEDMKIAMRNKDKERLSVIRMVRASIQRIEVDTRAELTEAETADVLAKEVKQRRDAILEFTKGGREDLASANEKEIAILMDYLPKQLAPEELQAMITAVISEVGASSPKDMGKVMGKIAPLTRGKADGRMVQEMVVASLKEIQG